MNTPETITKKIQYASDVKLKSEIEKEFASLPGLIGDSYPHTFLIIPKDSNGKEVEIYAGDCLSKLKDLAFEVHKEKRRDEAISEFISKVDQLQNQIEELQGQIQ